MQSEIKQRQFKRFSLLYELYKETKANTKKSVDLLKKADSIGITNGVYEEAKQYLTDQGYVYFRNTEDNLCTITHEGKIVVEDTVLFPQGRHNGFSSFDDMGIS